MDKQALIQALSVVRDVCAAAKAEVSPAMRGQLEIACTLLSKQIADARDLPKFKHQLLAQFGAQITEIAPGHADEGFDAVIKVLQDLLRNKENTNSLWAKRLNLAADIGSTFAQGYDKIITGELAASAKSQQQSASAHDVFDKAALRNYLTGTFPGESALEVTRADVVSLGFSKKTMIVGLANGRELPAEIVLRIDRPFNFLGTTVVEEYEPLVVLHRHGIRVAKPYAVEISGRVLGAPFAVFEKISGAPIGSNVHLPSRNLPLAEDIAVCLGQLHQLPAEALPELRGAKTSVLEGVRWEIDKSYEDWRALERDVPVVEAAFSWLRAHIAIADGPKVILHGDFNFNNLLIENDRVAAIVDWEFVHIGNPASDLGWFHYGAGSVAGWDNFLDMYRQTGCVLPDKPALDYYTLLAQTRISVMGLQSESGFDAGKMDDIRYGMVGSLVVNKFLTRLGTKFQELLRSY